MRGTMNSKLTSWILGAGLGFAAQARAAEIGTAFTYQGKLTDAGNPAPGELRDQSGGAFCVAAASNTQRSGEQIMRAQARELAEYASRRRSPCCTDGVKKRPTECRRQAADDPVARSLRMFFTLSMLVIAWSWVLYFVHAVASDERQRRVVLRKL